MSRHGSIFYDAPEALSCLILNEDKEEIEKMVKRMRETNRRERTFAFSPIRNRPVVVTMKVMPMMRLVHQQFHIN